MGRGGRPALPSLARHDTWGLEGRKLFHSSFMVFRSQILISMNSKSNILIDKDGHARLADFGLASIIRGEYSHFSPQVSNSENTTTWAAPEILGGSSASKEGDVFTFAMVAIEVRTRGVSNGSFSAYLPSTRRSRGVPLSSTKPMLVYLI